MSLVLCWLACADPLPVALPAPSALYVAGPRLTFDAALGPCMDAELADLDGDGDTDVALAMEFAPNVVLWNDGAAGFTPEELGAVGGDSEEVAALDVEGDGDLDLLYVNEDLGGADLDGDDLPEVIIANNGPDAVWTADGAGGFTDVTADWMDVVDDKGQDVELETWTATGCWIS